MQQTFTQTITFIRGGETLSGSLASTGINFMLVVLVAMVLLFISAMLYYFYARSGRGLSRKNKTSRGFMGFGGFTLLSLATIGVVFSLETVNAAPSLTISGEKSITIVLPEGGGTVNRTTALKSSTLNPTGYVLSAKLVTAEPGITLGLKGGALANSTSLTPNSAPLIVKTTSVANSSGSDDSTGVDMSFTIDSTVATGTKKLAIEYAITDNPYTPAPVTMQAMTKEYCNNNMAIYTGTNEDAVLSLTDDRGGITRTYRVAKLADGNCWMLDNLKLGSTAGSITLTPTDSNVASNFTLPQVKADNTYDYSTNPGNSYDTPQVHGPVPGDTGVGEINYGYLYNWSAATAGETRTTMPVTADDAQHSICASGWRLPSGGANGDFSKLDQTFGGTGGSVTAGPSLDNWKSDGAFHGVFAGNWYNGGFMHQDRYGYWWSRSATPAHLGNALGAHIDAGGVYPDSHYYRYSGRSIRCILNQN